MTNPTQFLTDRFSTATFVLPVILGLAIMTSYLNPKPFEPYREIVLDLTLQKQFCESHGTVLLPDVIHAECVETVRLNRPNPFPNADEECPQAVPDLRTNGPRSLIAQLAEEISNGNSIKRT